MWQRHNSSCFRCSWWKGGCCQWASVEKHSHKRSSHTLGNRQPRHTARHTARHSPNQGTVFLLTIAPGTNDHLASWRCHDLPWSRWHNLQNVPQNIGHRISRELDISCSVWHDTLQDLTSLSFYCAQGTTLVDAAICPSELAMAMHTIPDWLKWSDGMCQIENSDVQKHWESGRKPLELLCAATCPRSCPIDLRRRDHPPNYTFLIHVCPQLWQRRTFRKADVKTLKNNNQTTIKHEQRR